MPRTQRPFVRVALVSPQGDHTSYTPSRVAGAATFYATSTRVGLRGLFSVAHNRMCSVLCGFGDRDRLAGCVFEGPQNLAFLANAPAIPFVKYL
jgi:hypothetical protein